MSGTDRTKLDEYLSSVRETEQRVRRLDRQQKDDAPKVPLSKRPPVGQPKDFKEYARLMCDVIALAFQTDRTRIATLLMSRDLSGQVPWSELQAGVYECRRGTDVIRILVAGELPQTQNNALLHLFSGKEPGKFTAVVIVQRIQRASVGSIHAHREATLMKDAQRDQAVVGIGRICRRLTLRQPGHSIRGLLLMSLGRVGREHPCQHQQCHADRGDGDDAFGLRSAAPHARSIGTNGASHHLEAISNPKQLMPR